MLPKVDQIEINILGQTLQLEFEIDDSPYFLDYKQEYKPYVVWWKDINSNCSYTSMVNLGFRKQADGISKRILQEYIKDRS